MNIHPDACQHCGSAPSPRRVEMPPGHFYCGTIVNSDGVLQSDPCRLAEALIQRDQAQLLYAELVDALTSPAWLPRNDPDAVLTLARRMRARELKIVPMENDNAGT